MLFHLAEDWTGAINYYRNLPFSRVSASQDSPVDVPCLLIIGNQDSSVQLESVVRSAEYLSNYQLKIIDSVGHFPHQERPAEVNSLLLSFLISKYCSSFCYLGIQNSLLKVWRNNSQSGFLETCEEKMRIPLHQCSLTRGTASWFATVRSLP